MRQSNRNLYLVGLLVVGVVVTLIVLGNRVYGQQQVDSCDPELDPGCLSLPVVRSSSIYPKWHPLPKILLGALPINPLGTVIWDIPGVVPASATEIQVYVFVRTGGGNPAADIEFRIYTADNSVEYAQYLYAFGYSQNAWSYNSDTFWLPVTPDGLLRITSTGTAQTGNTQSALYIVGYR